MPAHPRDGAGGRPGPGRPPNGTVMIFILATMLLLMAFAVVAAMLHFTEMSAAAGTVAITLAGEVVRRLLSLARAGDDSTDSESDIASASTGEEPTGSPPVGKDDHRDGRDARTA